MRHSSFFASCWVSLACVSSARAEYPWTQVAVGLTNPSVENVVTVPDGFVAVGSRKLLHGSGNTWTRFPDPFDTANYGSVAFQGLTGIAVGTGVIASRDGGATWQKLSILAGQKARMYDIQSDPAGGFWMVGERGLVFQISSNLDLFTPDSVDPAQIFSQVVTSPGSVWLLNNDGKRLVRRANGTWADSGNVLGNHAGNHWGMQVATHLPSGFWVSGREVGCGFAGCLTGVSVVRYSADGENWVDTLIDTSSRPKGVLAIGGSGDSLVLLAGENGFLARGRPGQPWKIDTTIPSTQSFGAVASNGTETIVLEMPSCAIFSNAVDPAAGVKQRPAVDQHWMLKVGNRYFPLQTSKPASSGVVHLEISDVTGKTSLVKAMVTNGTVDVQLPIHFANKIIILRSVDPSLHLSPLIIR